MWPLEQAIWPGSPHLQVLVSMWRSSDWTHVAGATATAVGTWSTWCSRPECSFPLSKTAGGGQVFEFLTEENQLHRGSGIWVHCTLDSSKREGSGLPSTEDSVPSTEDLVPSTEASALPGSLGRSGGSDPEWRSLRSPG